MTNKPKPDDRRDNVDKIQFNIDNTIENYNLTEKLIAKADDEEKKRELIEKNERREDALSSMRSEIKEEAAAKKNGYK